MSGASGSDPRASVGTGPAEPVRLIRTSRPLVASGREALFGPVAGAAATNTSGSTAMFTGAKSVAAAGRSTSGGPGTRSIRLSDQDQDHLHPISEAKADG